jgi:hypothetical protein
MSKNIILLGQDFADVPALNVPLQGGGTARFIDEDDAGSGGTSDFSIVTVTCNTNATRELCMATIMEPIEEVSGLVMFPLNIAASMEHSYSVALYKGKCLTYYSGPKSSISVSGNASLIESYGDVYVLITGDCDITLS